MATTVEDGRVVTRKTKFLVHIEKDFKCWIQTTQRQLSVMRSGPDGAMRQLSTGQGA